MGQIIYAWRLCSLKALIASHFYLLPMYPNGLLRRSATVKRVNALPERKPPYSISTSLMSRRGAANSAVARQGDATTYLIDLDIE